MDSMIILDIVLYIIMVPQMVLLSRLPLQLLRHLAINQDMLYIQLKVVD